MKWRRRQYLIDRKFQWRFVSRLIIPLILGLTIITFADYYFVWSFFTFPSPGRYENLGFVSLEIIAYIFFYTLCLFIPILGIIGIVISHRIAGPLFHIEHVLKAIGDGALSSRVTLRRKDELKNLAMSVNEMAESLSGKISEIEKEIKLLEGKFQFLESESGKELPNMNKIREEIKTLSSSFTILKDKLAEFGKNN